MLHTAFLRLLAQEILNSRLVPYRSGETTIVQRGRAATRGVNVREPSDPLLRTTPYFVATPSMWVVAEQRVTTPQVVMLTEPLVFEHVNRRPVAAGAGVGVRVWAAVTPEQNRERTAEAAKSLVMV